jgi:hypothetical protein
MTNPSEPSRQNIDDQLREMLKYLRLGRLLAHWEETLEKARQGRYSPERLLKYVVEEECRAKRENARLLRRQRANIPEMLEMETFPFHKQPKLDGCNSPSAAWERCKSERFLMLARYCMHEKKGSCCKL